MFDEEVRDAYMEFLQDLSWNFNKKGKVLEREAVEAAHKWAVDHGFFYYNEDIKKEG